MTWSRCALGLIGCLWAAPLLAKPPPVWIEVQADRGTALPAGPLHLSVDRREVGLLLPGEPLLVPVKRAEDALPVSLPFRAGERTTAYFKQPGYADCVVTYRMKQERAGRVLEIEGGAQQPLGTGPMDAAEVSCVAREAGK